MKRTLWRWVCEGILHLLLVWGAMRLIYGSRVSIALILIGWVLSFTLRVFQVRSGADKGDPWRIDELWKK